MSHMNQNIKSYIKYMPNYLWLHNHYFGSNKIKKSFNNTISIGAAFLKKTKITIDGINNTIIIKDSANLINCDIFVYGNDNLITIGQSVSLVETVLWAQDNKNEIKIGDHSTVFGLVQLAALEGTSLIIGNDCMFARNIQCRTGDGHSIVDSSGTRINKSESVVIGNHVWVGDRVLCLKGTNIGNNCIIGAGSIVTKKFSEDNIVLAGTPAHIIKRDINWLRERV